MGATSRVVLLLSIIFGTDHFSTAQLASAPASGGLLASAPAPGTPGDYTITSGLYTYTITPNISLGSFQRKAQSYFSGNNGSLASAGSTSLLYTSSGLITAQISSPPSPMNTTMPAQRWILTDPFGGAACVSYSFTSNASAATVSIADADQYLDANYPRVPSRIPYATCGASNCTTSSTYALNATAGHYYFNISNPSNSPANVVLAYTLYPANSSACQGLSTTSQIPTPYTQTTAAIVTPPLKSTAIITYDTLPNDGFLALEGSVRNTSCVTALLNVNATTPSGRIPLASSVYLLLLDQHGMEDLLNPSTAQLVPTGGCQAGVITTSCAFTASGLVPGQAYHLWLVYTGNRSADGLRDDALVTATFATSTSAGNCSNLISTNATNGGFKGYITFFSSGPATAPSSLSNFPSSPSIAPSAASSTPSSSPSQSSSPSRAPSPSPSSSATPSTSPSPNNAPVSIGNGIFYNPNGFVAGLSGSPSG